MLINKHYYINTYINCMYCINVLILLINIIDYYPRAVAMCSYVWNAEGKMEHHVITLSESARCAVSV